MPTNLPDTLNFDADDLDLNRAGRVSPSQMRIVQNALAEENKDFIFGMTFLVLPVLFGCGVCFFLFNVPVIIGSVDYLPELLGVLLALTALGTLWSAWQGRQNTRARRQGIAQAITGPLALIGDEDRKRPRFYIVIGEDRFRVPWRIYDALLHYNHLEQPHTLYYVPGMRWVLSMELA